MKRLLLIFSMMSCWVASHGQLTAPFTESFNSSAMPAGWTNTNNASSTSAASLWKFSGSMAYDASSVTNHSGSTGHFAWADGSTPVPSRVELTTDSIDMSALTNPMVRFYLFSNNVTYPASGLNTIFIDFYDGSSWNDSIWGYSGSNPNWQEIDVLLSSYTITGKCLIRFVVDQSIATTAYYNDIAIDDILVDNVPSCPKPTAFSSSAATSNSITLNWVTGGATSWEVEYGPLGHSPGNGTIVTANTSNNFVLGSLSPSTIYDIYVRDYCSSTDQSFWRGPITDTTTCVSALSGTYTIDKNSAASTTNFTSISDLASSLSFCGVSGPVTVNVLTGSGPYTEQVEFQSIPGASSTNNITINGNGEMLVDSGNVGSNYAAVLLNGTQHLIIDSLHIENTSTSNAVGLQFMGADSNIVRNSVIKVLDNGTTTSIYGITFSASPTSVSTSGNNGNYNLIEGNEIIGGYYGLRIYGASASRVDGNQVVDNNVRDFRYGGIYNYYTSGSLIKGNEVHRPNRSTVTNAYGIYVGYSDGGTEVSYNWVHDLFAQATNSTSSAYPFYISAADNSAGNEGKLYNNLVTNIGGTGNHLSIYNSGSDYWDYYHNTIVDDAPLSSGTGYSRLLYVTSSSNINFQNNLLYLDRATTGSHYLAYLNSTASNVSMDNNAYYFESSVPSANFGYYGGAVADFTSWQTVNSGAFDQNSAEGSPLFVDVANDDYTPGAAYFNDIGANLQSIVADDFYGASRSTTPDPGAIEFTPPPGPDMAVLNIYSAGASCGATTNIIIEVLNQGTDTVTSFNVNYDINSVGQTAIPVTGSWTSGAIDSVIISGIPITASALTTVDVNIAGVAPGTDVDPSNNDGTIDLRQGLSGTYTVDQSAAASTTNFINFSSLADALITYGVCGNVTVNVAGTANIYTERFWLDEVSGTSSSATITINGNGNTIQYLATKSTERATITLNGTDWVTIDSLNVVAMGSSSSEYGFGFSITNNADHNTVNNCIITVADDQVNSNYAGIAISGSLSSASGTGESGNYNTITNNTITGGYYGITSYGSSSDSANGNIISNNLIEDIYYSGITMYYNRDLQCINNDISRSTRSTIGTLYALRATYGMSLRIEGNKIHDGSTGNPTSTSLSYYLYVSSMEGTTADPTVVANNMIYNIESDGSKTALYLSSLNNTHILHNTLVLQDLAYGGSSSPYCRGVYLSSTMTDVNFSNNLIYYDVNTPGTSNSYMVYASTMPAIINNNVYYIGANAPGNFGYANGSQHTTFNSWQAAVNLDQNSVLTNPFLTNITSNDYTPQSLVIDGLGSDYTSIVATDINGASRSVPTDPGAIEFAGAPCTGLSGIKDTVTATSATVMWNGPGQDADILWGPTGFMQASITPDTVHVSAIDTNGTITGMTSNTCYDYYIQLTCTSPIPGAPSLMGPYTICTECTGGALNGTYTVGGTAGPNNFATLDSAIGALQGCGINGAVVFNLQGGTHDGFTLGHVDGISATNTITFNGSASLGDTIAGISGMDAAIDLDGASYLNFNDLYIEFSANANYTVWMHNASRHISFDGCTIMGDTTRTSPSAVVGASNSPTVVTSAGDNVAHLSVTNSIIKGNYYGIIINGSGTSAKTDNIILTDNQISNVYYYGLRVNYTDTVEVSHNSVRDLRNSSSYGIYLNYADNMQVLANEVYGANTSAMSIYNTNRNANGNGSYSLVANNMLHSDGNYGLYIYYPSYMDVHHNSVYANTSGTYRTVYLTGSSSLTTDVDFRNNIFENHGTGDAFNVGTEPMNTTVDYNLYFSNGDISNDGATLAAWQTAVPSWNQNSLEGTITSFASVNDLHSAGTLPNDVGDNTAGITVDFDGDVRPASGSTVVDMGADEYTPLNFDVTPDMVISPLNGSCGDSNTSVSVVLTNLGQQVVTSVGVTVNITGANTATLTGTYTGSLAYLDSDTVTVSSFNSFMGGSFNFETILSYTGDQNASNDTLLVSGIEIISGTTEIYPIDTMCANDSIGEFAAVSQTGITYNWYQNATDVTPFATGDTVDVLPNQTLFVDRSKEVDQLVVDAPHTSSQFGNMFKIYVKNDFTFTGFSFVPATSGTVEPIAFYKQGNFVGHETTRGSWTAIDSLTIPGASANNWYRINFTNSVQFNAGDTISFYLANKQGTKMRWENLTSLNAVGDLLFDNVDFEYYAGVTGAYFGNNMTSGGPRAVSSVMHYSSADVCGGGRVSFTMPVNNDTAVANFTSVVNANGADVDFDASASKGNTYAWDFGDGQSGTGVNPTNTYANAGSYTVTLVVTDTVCGTTDTISKTVMATVSLTELSLNGSVEVYPNPNNGKFNVNLDLVGGQDVQLALANTVGQIVYTKDLGRVGGQIETELNIENLTPGVYYLRVMGNGKTKTVKITVFN